jgi:simple sugar transport system permease protein
MNKISRRLSRDRKLMILYAVTLFVALAFALTMPGAMYSGRNLTSMAYQIPEFGLIALGMTLSFLIGGIDLSIVAIANTSGIFAALVLTGRWFPGLDGAAAVWVAAAVALLSSVAFGLFNGFLVAKLSAPPLIATLGTMTLYTGIGMALTGGKGVTGLPDAFSNFGVVEVYGVPLIFLLFLAAVLILSYILNWTAFGRKVTLYGSNHTAARFSAINNERLTLGIFVVIGLLAGLAGLIIVSRVNSAKVGYGDAYLLQAMLVCVVGGIHPDGGRGKVAGAVCAILLMQLLSSAFTVWKFSPYAKKLIWGFMLITVMGLNYISDKRMQRVNYRGKTAREG